MHLKPQLRQRERENKTGNTDTDISTSILCLVELVAKSKRFLFSSPPFFSPLVKCDYSLSYNKRMKKKTADECNRRENEIEREANQGKREIFAFSARSSKEFDQRADQILQLTFGQVFLFLLPDRELRWICHTNRVAVFSVCLFGAVGQICVLSKRAWLFCLRRVITLNYPPKKRIWSGKQFSFLILMFDGGWENRGRPPPPPPPSLQGRNNNNFLLAWLCPRLAFFSFVPPPTKWPFFIS